MWDIKTIQKTFDNWIAITNFADENIEICFPIGNHVNYSFICDIFWSEEINYYVENLPVAPVHIHYTL